jgi:Fur family ferric uptake transcriptional regulator
MTVASLPTVLNTMRAHGLRVSAARRLVLEALMAAERPLTAEEIAGGRTDLAAVYRNLEALEAIGIVRHVHLGHGPGRYALSGRSAGWATCEACGRSTPLASAALQRIRVAVREAAGFDAGFSHFPIVGRCPDCILASHA